MNIRLIKLPPMNIVHGLMEYPTPSNISYLWNFGSLSGFALGIQIVTGIILAMHYTPHVDYAFLSIEHIMRDVNYGWLIRYLHSNGASMFFIVVYLHMLRGLYYGSYGFPRHMVWIVGVIIYLLMMGAAFLGYVLPWGQMSLWGATVITNILGTLPIIGEQLVLLLWGGYAVDNATLNRFFSLHYLLPFVIAAFALSHVIVLHEPKSSNPLGLNSSVDRVPFHPYHTYKDIFGVLLFMSLFSYFLFFNPNMLGHPDNYIPANPMSTPPHIVPEWYYLPHYAILRSIPNKLGGVLGMLGAILVLLVLPFTNTSQIRSSSFRPIHKHFYWLLVVDCLILGWIGGNAPEAPYTWIGLIGTVYYFVYMLVLIPFIGSLENILLRSGKFSKLEESTSTIKNSSNVLLTTGNNQYIPKQFVF